MNKSSNIFLLLLSALFAACTAEPLFLEFKSVPQTGWHKDSALVFNVDIQDTVNAYDILFHIRHTDAYHYQNMWLFVGDNDTIEFYLADDYGRWLGEKGMHHISMPVLYEYAYRFDSVGTYTFALKHGMRSDVLKGITDVGVEIRQTANE